MKKMWSWIAFLLVLAISFSGCGNEKPAATQKVLKIGTSADFSPFEFMDDKGKMTGFDVELMGALAKQMNRKLEMQNISFDGLIPALQKGDLDIAISGMTITEKRKESIIFSDALPSWNGEQCPAKQGPLSRTAYD